MKLDTLPARLYVVGNQVFTTRKEARDALTAHRTLGNKNIRIQARDISDTANVVS